MNEASNFIGMAHSALGTYYIRDLMPLGVFIKEM